MTDHQSKSQLKRIAAMTTPSTPSDQEVLRHAYNRTPRMTAMTNSEDENDENNDLYWLALHFRAASTPDANECWIELRKYVDRLLQQAAQPVEPAIHSTDTQENFEQMVERLSAAHNIYQGWDGPHLVDVTAFARAVCKWQAQLDAEICEAFWTDDGTAQKCTTEILRDAGIE